jgi:hypothetical protein
MPGVNATGVSLAGLEQAEAPSKDNPQTIERRNEQFDITNTLLKSVAAT